MTSSYRLRRSLRFIPPSDPDDLDVDLDATLAIYQQLLEHQLLVVDEQVAKAREALEKARDAENELVWLVFAKS